MILRLFLKDVIARFLTPTPFIGFLLLVSTICLWKNKTKQLKYLLPITTFLFFFFGLDPVTDSLVKVYERKYPDFKMERLSPTQKSKVAYVVVLGGGYRLAQNQPLTSQLTNNTLIRLIEGIRIYREFNGQAKIIFTGKGFGDEPEAVGMKKMAMALGVPEKDIIEDPLSNNTFEHTQNLLNYLKDDNFVLVTSALHLKRAMSLFKKAGMNPIPAPTNHIVSEYSSFFPAKLFMASGSNFSAIDTWFYETYGYLWGILNGSI